MYANAANTFQWTLPDTALQFHTGGIVQGTTDGAEVKAELEAIEADKRDKRIRKLTKAHRKAWYADPDEWDVASYWPTDDTREVAVANRMADGEIRWRVTGRIMTMSFAAFVGHLVDHNVPPECVYPLIDTTESDVS